MDCQIFLRLALLSTLLNSRFFVAAGSGGDDFSNNLFTDLAPLLSLFGEQFAKQFLSESSSLAELILFAMAPLGVLTALVGAIRVGGASWLKRLVGRARENFADVEIELMSSVSKEVCELWNGTSIVRSKGNPQVKQIIHLPAEDGDISPESFITMDSDTGSKENPKYKLIAGDKKGKHFKLDGLTHLLSKNADGNDRNMKADVEAQEIQVTGRRNSDNGLPSDSTPITQKPKGVATNKYKGTPPNISLNIHGGSNPTELWVCAACATGLQVGVLVWSWHAEKYKLTALKPMVGFWLQMIGTVVLTFSLIACAGIIDHRSRERRWSRQVGHGRGIQLFWLQKQHTAGDNNFDPYILYAKESTDYVLESHRRESHGRESHGRESHKRESHRRESHRRPSPTVRESRQKNHNGERNKQIMGIPLPRTFPSYNVSRSTTIAVDNVSRLTTVAVVSGVLAFVAQFQGLRFSNWSCSVAQLIALAAATFLRALVRRDMTKTPGAVPVDNEYMLDHLTVAMVRHGLNGSRSIIPKDFDAPGLSFAFGVTTIPTLRVVSERENDASPGAKPKALSSGSQPSVGAQRPKEDSNRPSLAQQALDLRVRLGQITKWTGAYGQEAVMLANSIETALETLHLQLPGSHKWAVVFPINTCRTLRDALPTLRSTDQEEVKLSIMKVGNGWKVDDAQLEALLSLASYSARVTKQIIGNRAAREGEKSSSALKSSKARTEQPAVEHCPPISWLRPKAPELPVYEKFIGKSSPRLVSDLSWWMGDVEGVNDIKQNNVFAHPTSSSSDCEANYGKVIDPLALGFYANVESSQESNFFVFSRCTERQAFILHLFSAFIWAITDCVSAQDFHPTTVIDHIAVDPTLLASFADLFSTENYPSDLITGGCFRLKSDKMENLVQELRILGLGTSHEIYQVLIPPLSHFDKLPNEAVADWCHQSLLAQKDYMFSAATVKGYQGLLAAIQHREVKDRFACRTAAIILVFLFRFYDDLEPSKSVDRSTLNEFKEHLRLEDKNDALFKSIKSLRPLIQRQGKMKMINWMWDKLELDHLRLDISPSADDEAGSDFTFPNSTDVFGWTKEYWTNFHAYLFQLGGVFYRMLDLAGQSVLHNAIDAVDDNSIMNKSRLGDILSAFRLQSLSEDSELLTAKCDGQTPLHRAAKLGLDRQVVSLLYYKGIDPNAQDFFGRTALCFAAQNGNVSVIEQLCKKMKGDLNQQDRGRKNALHYAIRNCQEKAALTLIQRKIKLNQSDSWGNTPLRYAANRGMEMVVKALLEEDGIQINIRGGFKNTTAKEEAQSLGRDKIVEMIEEWERKNGKQAEAKEEQSKGKSPSRPGSIADGLIEKEKKIEEAESSGHTEVVKMIKEEEKTDEKQAEVNDEKSKGKSRSRPGSIADGMTDRKE